jgi:hypothetical protein
VRSALRKATVRRDGSAVQVEARLALEDTAALGEEVTRLTEYRLAANNLKQAALAMQNFHDSFGALPAAGITDKAGKPLLSWRVALLPYLEQGELYKQFKLDEPWDSDHNKKLLEKMPRIYAPPRGKTKEPYTTYMQVFTGPDTPFDPARATRGPASLGARLSQFADGTSNTLLVVEAGEAVPWTKPDDVVYDAKKAVPKLGGVFADGFHAAVADGSVWFFKKSLDPAALRALISPNGGEVFDWDKLPARPADGSRRGSFAPGPRATAPGAGDRPASTPPKKGMRDEG